MKLMLVIFFLFPIVSFAEMTYDKDGYCSTGEYGSLSTCLAHNRDLDTKKLEEIISLYGARLDEQGKSLLSSSQSAWVKYQKSTCALNSDNARGGSISKLHYSSCLNSLQRARNYELRCFYSFYFKDYDPDENADRKYCEEVWGRGEE